MIRAGHADLVRVDPYCGPQSAMAAARLLPRRAERLAGAHHGNQAKRDVMPQQLEIARITATDETTVLERIGRGLRTVERDRVGLAGRAEPRRRRVRDRPLR